MYVLAQLVGINVAQLFSKDAKVPKIEEIFPHLFGEEYSVEQVEESKLCKAESKFLAGLATHLLDRVDIDFKDKDM